MVPSRSSFSRWIAAASYAPRWVVLFHSSAGGAAADDELLGLVEERHARVVLGGALAPGRREHLVGTPPEQDRRRAAGDRPEGLAHGGVEAELEGPAGVLEDAVEGDELVHCDGGHGGDPSGASVAVTLSTNGAQRRTTGRREKTSRTRRDGEQVAGLAAERVAHRRQRREPDRLGPLVLQHAQVHHRDPDLLGQRGQRQPPPASSSASSRHTTRCGSSTGTRRAPRRPR